ncbi:MAG: histidine phosphotransferase [Synechococcus sp.]|nr:histidine phosphotransferase [Synechococcus sp.]
MPFNESSRLTRRRSSAGPVPPNRPQRFGADSPSRGGHRATYLTLADHGKVFVADLPQMSDGQLENVQREALEVLDSLERRIADLELQLGTNPRDDSVIRARTKRDVTDRFLKAIAQEQERRRENPHLQAAAGESLARAFLEVARHRLPGATFDSLLQEALVACENRPAAMPPEASVVPIPSETLNASDNEDSPEVLPVVLSPDL